MIDDKFDDVTNKLYKYNLISIQKRLYGFSLGLYRSK